MIVTLWEFGLLLLHGTKNTTFLSYSVSTHLTNEVTWKATSPTSDLTDLATELLALHICSPAAAAVASFISRCSVDATPCRQQGSKQHKLGRPGHRGSHSGIIYGIIWGPGGPWTSKRKKKGLCDKSCVAGNRGSCFFFFRIWRPIGSHKNTGFLGEGQHHYHRVSSPAKQRETKCGVWIGGMLWLAHSLQDSH